MFQQGEMVRMIETTQAGWTYTSAAQQQDGLDGAFDVTVAQISATYGPGPVQRLYVGV